MLVLDVILLWLHTSTTLSWVIPSSSIYRKYFFPVPNIPLRAGETGLVVNVGGILVTWLLVWIKSSLIDRFIAKRLLSAQKYRKDLRRQQRREARRLANDAAISTTTELTKPEEESHNTNGTGIGLRLKKHQVVQDLPTPSISDASVHVSTDSIHQELAHGTLQCDYVNEEQEQAHSFMDLD